MPTVTFLSLKIIGYFLRVPLNTQFVDDKRVKYSKFTRNPFKNPLQED